MIQKILFLDHHQIVLNKKHGITFQEMDEMGLLDPNSLDYISKEFDDDFIVYAFPFSPTYVHYLEDDNNLFDEIISDQKS